MHSHFVVALLQRAQEQNERSGDGDCKDQRDEFIGVTHHQSFAHDGRVNGLNRAARERDGDDHGHQFGGEPAGQGDGLRE